MTDIKNLNNQVQLIKQNGTHHLNQPNSEKDLRMNVLHIFYDLIAELENEGPDFKQIQSKLVDKLDAAVFEHKSDEEFKTSFITLKNVNFALYDKINVMDKAWREKGIQMIQNLTKLIDLLIDYRLVLNEADSRDKQMTCIAYLLHFYKNRIYKKELYVKHIYKLYDLHLSAENYTEMAFTLLLHADLFNWSFNPIKEFIIATDNQIINNQSTGAKLEWQRKEELYLKIIDYFEKGKNYEEGINLIKEMETFFEKHFEYHKLSNLIKKKAIFYDNILTQFRFEPNYFRVGYYGCGFPLFLRNRIFVYKGLDFEKLGDFIQRISNEYPKAEILTTSNSPEQDILKSNLMYIQIVTVKPIAELPPELEVKQEISDKVCAYYLTNKVDTFVYDRRLVKESADKSDNEFKSIWCERTIIKIEKKLPGILRWFEVIDQKVYQLTPVENACDTIENVNKELKKLVISYNYEPNKQLTPLTMRLQGTIDASVNGGVKRYQEAFFDPVYIEQNLNYYQHIKRLKKLIFNQINLLETGLAVHQRLVPSSLLPLHEMLVEKFQSMKNSFIYDSSYIVDIQYDKKASIVNTPLPPLPIQHHTMGKMTIQQYKNKELVNRNLSEDDLYSVLETTNQSNSHLSPFETNFNSSNAINKHKSLNGSIFTTNSSIPYNNSTSLINGQSNGNKIVYVSVSNGQTNQLINQRSNSMPRNNLDQSDPPQIPPRLSTDPRSNDKLTKPSLLNSTPQVFSQSKLSLESGIDTDISDNSLNSKPALPKRTNKKTILTASDQPSMLISIDIDKNRSSVNTVITSNSSYIEKKSDDLPPLPPKKFRLPSSRSTTIININNNDSELNSSGLNNELNTNGMLTNLMHNNCHLNGNLINHHPHSEDNSSSSTMSSSSNEYMFSETNNLSNTVTTTLTSSSSSKSETMHHQIHNLSLNDSKDY